MYRIAYLAHVLCHDMKSTDFYHQGPCDDNDTVNFP